MKGLYYLAFLFGLGPLAPFVAVPVGVLYFSVKLLQAIFGGRPKERAIYRW